MPQFTPPQMNPMILKLLEDDRRQQEWERNQNARILTERRAQQSKQEAAQLKYRLDMMKEVAKGGGNAYASDLYSELGRIGQLGAQEKKDDVLAPLVATGAQIAGIDPGDTSPESAALIRSGSSTIGKRMQSDPASAGRLQELILGERADVAKKDRERRAQLHKEASLMKESRESLVRDMRSSRKQANEFSSRGFGDTPAGRAAMENYISAKMKHDAYVGGDSQTITFGEDGSVTFTKGGQQKMNAQLRAIDTVNSMDNVIRDAMVARDIIRKDPSLAGTAGGIQNIMNTFSSILSDIGQMAVGDVTNGLVDDELADHIETALTGDGEIQGMKLLEMSFAYAWVRNKRGSRRITMEEYNRALERLRLVGGMRGSKQVTSTLNWFIRDMKRTARQNRSRFHDAWGLEIKDTSEEELSTGEPVNPGAPMRREVEDLWGELGGQGGR